MHSQVEANDLGRKAYENGVDLFNVPSYLSQREQVWWREGYEEAMHDETIEFMKESEDEYVMEALYPHSECPDPDFEIGIGEQL